MARDEERRARAQQGPIVGGLPEVPGIGVAMRLTPGLGVHLRGLADVRHLSHRSIEPQHAGALAQRLGIAVDGERMQRPDPAGAPAHERDVRPDA